MSGSIFQGLPQPPADNAPPAAGDWLAHLDFQKSQAPAPHVREIQEQGESPNSAPLGPGGTSATPVSAPLDATDDGQDVEEVDMAEGGDEVDVSAQEDQKGAIEAVYGVGCPMAKDGEVAESDWVDFAKALWDRHAVGVQARIHQIERNRLFYEGVQWVSSVGLGPWREPPKPRDAVRLVDNMIQPAINQRVEIVAEQRPGWQTEPENGDPEKAKQAEAKQIGLEYQYDQQDMRLVIREAQKHALTDGVAFLETYWDDERGPWEEMLSLGGQHAPLGDVCCKVLRMEQVRVSSGATLTQRPQYWVVREVMPKADAVSRYGVAVATASESEGGNDTATSHVSPAIRNGYAVPDENELHRDQAVVDVFRVYLEPNATCGLPHGLAFTVVGKALVAPPDALKTGKAPIAVWRDGTPDPAFYPRPEMDSWIDSQMLTNAIKSKWVESIRLNAGGKLLVRPQSISTETLLGGVLSVWEVKGQGPLSDAIMALPPGTVGTDAKELLTLAVQRFEQLSGWNDATRGSFQSDESGRAILAIREQVERIFAPMVNAASEAMTQWAEHSLAWMAYGYALPRQLAVQGQSRPDLARAFSGEDFSGIENVKIEPETLMPMPRSLRLFLLKDMLQQGVIDQNEYRRRLPFAWTKSMTTPDDAQEARARRVCESIRTSGNPQALPLLWQDNEAIHQDILERELILPDETPPPIRQAAIQRWSMLAQQANAKHPPPPPPPPKQTILDTIAFKDVAGMFPMAAMQMLKDAIPGYMGEQPVLPVTPTEKGQAPHQTGTPIQHAVHGSGEPHKVREGLKPDPHQQPFASTNPSIAAGDAQQMGGQSDAVIAGQNFDKISPM